MTDEDYLKLAAQLDAAFKEHLDAHPICEICKKAPSLKITRWGRITAACQDCLNDELDRFNEFCKQEEEYENYLKEEYGEGRYRY